MAVGVLFSGGADSAYALFEVLRRETDVHVCHYVYAKNNALAQRQAVEDITAEFKRLGYALRVHYTTITTTLDVPNHNHYPAMVIMNLIATYPEITDIYRGDCLDDCEWVEGGGFTSEWHYWVRTQSILAVLMNVEIDPLLNRRIPRVHELGSDQRKADLLRALPPSIRTLCWSCDFPIERGGETYRCLTCRKCEAYNEVLCDH